MKSSWNHYTGSVLTDIQAIIETWADFDERHDPISQLPLTISGSKFHSKDPLKLINLFNLLLRTCLSQRNFCFIFCSFLSENTPFRILEKLNFKIFRTPLVCLHLLRSTNVPYGRTNSGELPPGLITPIVFITENTLKT